MSSENFWKFVHVKIPQSGCYNQVNHGGHTEQLCLVDRDLEECSQLDNILNKKICFFFK